jgi:hypothetical protein
MAAYGYLVPLNPRISLAPHKIHFARIIVCSLDKKAKMKICPNICQPKDGQN